MSAFLNDWHLWLKALHIIFAVAWMAGMLYLPRLFVYHAAAKKGSGQDLTFRVMERRLLKVIMNPAMVLVWVLGVTLLFTPAAGVSFADGWIWVKLAAVSGLTWFHHVLARWVKVFGAGENRRDQAFYRKVNELPALLLVIIVIMVVVRPF